MATAMTGPVPLFVDIAPGGNPSSSGDDWTWVDITNDVRHAQGVLIEDGRPDEANQVDAGQINLALNNGPSKVTSTLGVSGCYSPRNPNGPYYGTLKKNVPLRAGTIAGNDTFSRTSASQWNTADSGDTWIVTGTATDWTVSSGSGFFTSPLNVNSYARMPLGGGIDVDVTATFAVTAISTGASQVMGIMSRFLDASNYYYGTVEFDTTATITLKIRKRVGAVVSTLATLALPSSTYSAGERWMCRFQSDGARHRLMAWRESDPLPTAWHLLASDADLVTPTGVGVYLWRVAGNTNAATPHFAVDNFRVKVVEGFGNVVELPVRWDQSGNDSWAPITAAGILRRLEQGDDPLDSPLRNQLMSYVNAGDSAGYWTGEDGADADSLGSSDGVSAAGRLIGNYATASDDTLPGAITTFKLSDGASRAQFVCGRSTVGGSGFSGMFLHRAENAMVAETEIAKWITTGLITTWRFYLDVTGGVQLRGWDASGTLVVNQGAATSFDFTQWCAYQLETEVSGGSTFWTMIIHRVGTLSFQSFTNTLATTAAIRPVSLQLTGNGTGAAYFSHPYMGQNTLPFVTVPFAAVANGYNTEGSSERITRVAAQAGIPIFVESGLNTTLGRQPRGGPLEVIRDAANANMGILYERGNSLAFRPRSQRYARGVELALSIPIGDLDEPPEPTDDDRYTRNDVTVSRTNAGGVRAVDEASVTELGRYADSVTLGLFNDGQASSHALWRVFLGTFDDLRWPRFKLNFRRNSQLIPLWRACRFGFRMTVGGELSQILGHPPDVIVEGRSQLIKIDEWTVDLNTSPARPWNTPILSDEWIFDFTNTTVEDLTTTETIIDTVTPVDEPQISSALVGATVRINGEDMLVTAVGGSGWTKTITVTRSINGVVKTHPIGSFLYLKNPPYVSL